MRGRKRREREIFHLLGSLPKCPHQESRILSLSLIRAAGTQILGPCSTAFPFAECWTETEQPVAPIWDTGIRNSGFTHCLTMLAPISASCGPSLSVLISVSFSPVMSSLCPPLLNTLHDNRGFATYRAYSTHHTNRCFQPSSRSNTRLTQKTCEKRPL